MNLIAGVNGGDAVLIAAFVVVFHLSVLFSNIFNSFEKSMHLLHYSLYDLYSICHLAFKQFTQLKMSQCLVFFYTS